MIDQARIAVGTNYGMTMFPTSNIVALQRRYSLYACIYSRNFYNVSACQKFDEHLLDISIGPDDTLGSIRDLFQVVVLVPPAERLCWMQVHVCDEDERQALIYLLDADHDVECTLVSHLHSIRR